MTADLQKTPRGRPAKLDSKSKANPVTPTSKKAKGTSTGEKRGRKPIGAVARPKYVPTGLPRGRPKKVVAAKKGADSKHVEKSPSSKKK